ncbi:hypothetical protein BLNAU_18136 [Blattamonas nauphoetae]|uniref:Protein kinase domain-containing protein n=1 Tax=Blattamonas nauphoetae TaxID=2049346 RepID=A0ABQ9X5D1_9EUKA|nr:hypothetical protein BLNAU_18136 [Blattamonas nauphoetae]
MNASIITAYTVKFCDSTSKRPNVYDTNKHLNFSHLVPPPLSNPTFVVDVSVREGTATVTATTTEEVKGTMGILLNGSNVPRLVFVQLGNSSQTSTTGSTVVYSGANGVLPQAEYELRASSLATNCFLPTSIHCAHASLSSDGDTADILVYGFNLGEGSYWMLIPNGDNTLNISLTRSNSTTLVGEAPLPPSTASGRLEWGTEFEIQTVMWHPQGGVEEEVRRTNTITFTTPNDPPHLLSFISRSLNGKKDELLISFVASALPVGTGTINVKRSNSNVLVEGVLTSDSVTQCTAVFSAAWTEDTTHLSFGKTYSVQSATIDSIDVVVDSEISSDVPNPPVITSFSLPVECSSDSFDIEVIGQNLPSSKTCTLALSDNHNISITFSSQTKGRGTMKASLPSEVQFDHEYSVLSMTKGEDHVLLNTTTFTTPLGPILNSISTDWKSPDKKEVLLTLSGSRMMSGKYTLTFHEQGTTAPLIISVSINTETSGSGSEMVYGGTKLKYGTTYEVISLTSDTLHFALAVSLRFKTPDEPSRLVKIVKTDDDGLNSTTLTLSSRVLTEGKKYEMKVTGTPISSSLSSSNGNHETTIKFTATSATENSVMLTLYPLEEASVLFGHSYCVDLMKVVGGASILVETESCVFETPKEPARICSCTGAVLNKDRSELTISLKGRALTEPLGSIWVSFGDTFWESLSLRTMSETSCEADFRVGSKQNTTHLKFEGEYTVCIKPAEPSTLLVDSGITVRIPVSPSFTKVEFEFTNSLGTGCVAVLTGTNLVKETEYEVKLNTSHTFSIIVKSSTRAESSEMLIGFEGSLSYSADILINSIEPTVEESGLALMPSPFTGRTPARPNVNEIFVDTETGQMNRTCGDFSNPFSTMDVAWKIVRTLEIKHPTFSLLDITSLSSLLTIESGMSVLIQNGTNNEPSLNIPSSTAESPVSALIVVSSAVLSIQNIDIVVGSSNPSFILISASSSKMILKDGLLTIKTESGRSGNEVEELCLWKTGLIELIDSELNVTNNQFFNISQGTMTMNGGQLNIHGSIFTNNFPNNQNFPSARRNIVCSGEGMIHIESLAAGDGSPLHPSAWISTDDCSIESTEVNSQSPLFIPTLSSDSTSTFDKKSKSFTLMIEGTTLIPCSLFLKVMEMRKDGKEINSALIPLTQDSATSFAETKIVITLPSSALDCLDDSLEWEGRLMFGQNQTSNNSFVIQQSSSGRFSQAIKDNMKWWIPLVVVVSCVLLGLILVVILLMRRRNKNKAEKHQMEEQQELDQTEDKIEVMKDECDDDNQNSVHTAGQKQLNPALTFHDSSSHLTLQNTNTITPKSGQAAVVIVGEDEFGRPKIEDGFVSSHDTLFNRLHGREGTSKLNIHQTRLNVVKAVEKLLSLRPNALTFQRLNPHWVMFTPSNALCFKLNDDTPSQAPTTLPTQSGAQKETQEEKRWAAPEEENNENVIDDLKVMVFRLGLILWEITTGQVPFSETDAVNAQRQLGIGVVPRMDSVEPVELSKLLRDCLDLNPQCRPSLESIVCRLESIGAGQKVDAADLLDLPDCPVELQPESRKPIPTF